MNFVINVNLIWNINEYKDTYFRFPLGYYWYTTLTSYISPQVNRSTFETIFLCLCCGCSSADLRPSTRQTSPRDGSREVKKMGTENHIWKVGIAKGWEPRCRCMHTQNMARSLNKTKKNMRPGGKSAGREELLCWGKNNHVSRRLLASSPPLARRVLITSSLTFSLCTCNYDDAARRQVEMEVRREGRISDWKLLCLSGKPFRA